MSCKLSTRFWIGSIPPVCKSSPLFHKVAVRHDRPQPWQIEYKCDVLVANCNWTDLDPVAMCSQNKLFLIHRMEGWPNYWGRSNVGIPRLEVYFLRSLRIDVWHAKLSVYDKWRNPEFIEWKFILVDLTKRFDTGLLEDIFRPKIDFRYLRVQV